MGKLTLRMWRRLRNMTQQEVADALGVTVQMYRRYESRVDSAKFGTVKRICEILEIKVEDIL